MQGFLNQVDYGNKIIGPRIDAFWLDNTLMISAMEQIEFLVRRKLFSPGKESEAFFPWLDKQRSR